jgi:flagellar basal-body rod protein FlgC
LPTNLQREIRGVHVAKVVEDQRDFIARIEPGHPDADENGIVQYPRVNLVKEMTNLMSASRSFDANPMVFNKLRAYDHQPTRIPGEYANHLDHQ